MKIFPSFIAEEIFLLKAFNDKQEEQIAEFINNFDKHIDTVEIERWYQASADDGEIVKDSVQHIAGVSEEDYDLKEMFSETMPLYQRQAMLITLWGAFECELEKMCVHLHKLKNEKYKIPKKKDDSLLNVLISELSKLDLPSNPSDEFNQSIEILNDEVRELRNSWAHKGGKDTKGIFAKGVDGIEIKYS